MCPAPSSHVTTNQADYLETIDFHGESAKKSVLSRALLSLPHCKHFQHFYQLNIPRRLSTSEGLLPITHTFNNAENKRKTPKLTEKILFSTHQGPVTVLTFRYRERSPRAVHRGRFASCGCDQKGDKPGTLYIAICGREPGRSTACTKKCLGNNFI